MNKAIVGINSRLTAASGENDLLNAADWLGTFFEQSWSIDPKYLKPNFVKKLLAPLVKQVAYQPANDKALYRVIGLDKELKVGQKISFKPDTLYSFTELADRDNWKALADQVGATDFDNCYVVKLEGSAHEMFNHKWALGPVLSYLVKRFGEDKRLKKLEEQQGYEWQREVVIFSNSALQTTVIAEINL